MIAEPTYSPEPTTDAVLASKDAPEATLDVETFDLAEWIAGVRPTRRAVTLYARGDLLADIDLLSERIRLARLAGDDTTADRATLSEVYEALAASALDVVVEARSLEAVKAVTDAMPSDATVLDQNLATIAAQIVEPAGLTTEMLRTVWQSQPHQVDLLLAACREANLKAPKVTPPFSGASSPAPSTSR